MSGAHIVGNHRPGIEHGGNFLKLPFAHLTINGKAGDEARIPVTDLYPKGAQMFQGIHVQVIGGEVNFQTTLAPADLAMEEAQDVSGWWGPEQAITTTAITKIINPTTVLRINFVADSVVFVTAV